MSTTDRNHHPSAPAFRDAEAPTSESTSNVWSDAKLLGYAPMDEMHEEFYLVVQQLLSSNEASMLGALDAFERHAVEHFEYEDEWMRSTGFPPIDCHVQEHAAVLKSTREVREAISSGQAGLALVHDFARHLFLWFPGHADYLDSALAAWLCNRTLGGQPVVLRRGVARHE